MFTKLFFLGDGIQEGVIIRACTEVQARTLLKEHVSMWDDYYCEGWFCHELTHMGRVGVIDLTDGIVRGMI